MTPLFFSKSFFEGIWGAQILPGFKLSSVFFFDLGVFILVIGMVILIARLL